MVFLDTVLEITYMRTKRAVKESTRKILTISKAKYYNKSLIPLGEVDYMDRWCHWAQLKIILRDTICCKWSMFEILASFAWIVNSLTQPLSFIWTWDQLWDNRHNKQRNYSWNLNNFYKKHAWSNININFNEINNLNTTAQ